MNMISGNEIVTIGIGQCGIHMLNSVISTMMTEHKIDKNGEFTGDWNNENDKALMLKNNVYFENDKRNNKYIPRAVFMDVDKTHVDAMKSSYLGSLISVDHFKSGAFAEPSVLWPKGHYGDGCEYIEKCLETVRGLVETCDYPQGFQMFHSISGGWGGGFGTLLLLKLRDNYPARCSNTFSVYPSTNKKQAFAHHNYNLAIHNSILSIHQILENTDMCYTFDNGKLFDFASKYCKLQHPTYDDLNWLLSQIVSGATSTLRFHGEPTVNATLSSFNVCFSPYPRLHFVTLCHSPFYSNKTYEYNSNVNTMISNLLEHNGVINVKLEDGKMLNSAFMYRSNDQNAIDKMDEYILKVQPKMADDFVTWIPSINVQSSFIYDGDNFAYKKYSPLICTAIIHTTAMKGVFQRLSAMFARVYKRKAFVHWYKAEGMDEMEFCEADKNVRDLITEYQDKQDAVVDLDWGDESDDY